MGGEVIAAVIGVVGIIIAAVIQRSGENAKEARDTNTAAMNSLNATMTKMMTENALNAQRDASVTLEMRRRLAEIRDTTAAIHGEVRDGKTQCRLCEGTVVTLERAAEKTLAAG